MSDIFFSVIIPTYNRSTLCYRAVQSVLAQTYPSFECIVVDDCSSDDTMSMISSIADPRVRIYRLDKNSGGSSVPINFGVAKANHAFVAILDSDDMWRSKRLSAACEQITESSPETGLFYCSSIIRYTKDLPRIVSAKTDGNIFPAIKFNNIIGIASRVILRRDVFLAAGGFDESRYMDNDWECWIRVCNITKVRSLITPLVIYTENSDSISSNPEKVINGRKIFLRNIHGEDFYEKNRDQSNIQLAKLLLSRGNARAARELLKSNKSKGIKYFLLMTSTYINRHVLLNMYSIISYFSFLLARIRK